jgi:hypothetical protein
MNENIVVVGVADGDVSLIDASSFTVMQQFATWTGPGFTEFATLTSTLSPDGSLAASGGDDRDSNGLALVNIVNMQTGQLTSSIAGSDGDLPPVFSPGGVRVEPGRLLMETILLDYDYVRIVSLCVDQFYGG